MSKLTVRKLDSKEPDALSLFESMDSLFEAIRQRAFGLFERRGGGFGADMDDWLTAERELVWIPQAELIDEQGQFRLRIALPGLEAKDINITATQDSLIVQAEAVRKGESESNKLQFSELSGKKAFRCFDFSEAIDPDKVQAVLERGILEVTVAKATPAKQVKVTVQTA